MDRKTIELNGMEELRQFLSRIGENTLVTIQVEILDSDQKRNDSEGNVELAQEESMVRG